jgi:tetratricopeptide (TPR) repeat protein
LDDPSASAQASPADERLDSWKEIASYLKRSVRTVQSWEVDEGMPVHRHFHDKRGTIYAFKPELDAWWRDRGALLADRNGDEEPVVLPVETEVFDRARDVAAVDLPRGRYWKAALIGSGFALAVLFLGVIAWLFRNGGSSGSLRPPPFNARDWVLVTSFENRTGEALFDGTLEYAFSRELANSRYVNVVPRERTADVLRLMRMPPDTRLDVAAGREVCLRDGGIRALIAGRIEKIGSKYVTSVEIIDPAQGTTLAGFGEQTTRQEGVLAALARLSDRIRVALGEVLPSVEQARPSLAKATTRSLKALRLLTQADGLFLDSNLPAAEQVLRQAVAEDPDFATGWIYLAHALSNQGKPRSEFLDYAEKALRLSGNASDRERLFIRGSYHEMLDQAARARSSYETLLRLYPDDYWAAYNLGGVYESLGLYDELTRMLVRIADLRPSDFSANVWAAYEIALSEGDLDVAKKYVERARALSSEETPQQWAGAAVLMELFPAFEYWSRGQIEESSKATDRVASRIQSLRAWPRTLFVNYVGTFYLTLGRLRAAEELFRKDPDRKVGLWNLSRLALARRDRDAMRSHLRDIREVTRGRAEWAALLFARAALFQESLRILKANEHGFRPGWASTIRGEVARGRGQIDKAITLLTEGTQRHSPRTGSYKHFLGAESLAEAWRQRRNPERACQALEQASDARRWAAFDFGGSLWIENQSRLAGLYRELGRTAQAKKIEDDLLRALSQADADHPVLLDIRRARASVHRAQPAG